MTLLKTTCQYMPRILCAGLAAALLGALSPSAQALELFDEKTQKTLGALGGSLMLGASPKKEASASNNTTSKKVFYFDYDPALSVKVREHIIKVASDIVRQEGALNEANEKEFADGLRQLDIMATIGGELKKKGFEPHSLATATAFWMVVNLEMVYGKEFTDQQNVATLKQVEQQMENSPEIQAMDNETKQWTAESLMWSATLQSLGYQGKSKEEQKALGNVAREQLKQFKFDPDRMILTSQGLVAKP